MIKKFQECLFLVLFIKDVHYSWDLACGSVFERWDVFWTYFSIYYQEKFLINNV